MTVGHRERGGAPAHENSPDVINVLNAVIDPLPLVGNVETPSQAHALLSNAIVARKDEKIMKNLSQILT